MEKKGVLNSQRVIYFSCQVSCKLISSWLLVKELGLFSLLVSRKFALILESSPIATDKTWKSAVIASISVESSKRGICEMTSLASKMLADSTCALEETGQERSEGSYYQQLSRKIFKNVSRYEMSLLLA